MKGEGWILSLDFGTAYSKAAAVPASAEGAEARRLVRALPIGGVVQAANPVLLPSVMFLDEGAITFGPLAEARAAACSAPKREALRSFKVLLGAGDLEQAMAQRPNRLLDPEGAFSYGQLITLYMAFFLGVVDEAFDAEDPAGAASQAQVRYTRPGWYSQRTSADHVFIRDLFSAARAALNELGHGFWRTPVTYAAAHRALQAGSAPVFVEGGLFEATAVAVCHLPTPLQAPMRLMVMDIGAGTTDIGGYLARPGASALEEIPDTRRVLTVAGDSLDRALMDALVDKAKLNRAPDLQAAFWRSLLGDIRTQKETMFDLGKMVVRFEGHFAMLTVKELERSPLYRELTGDISAAFNAALEATAEHAIASGDPKFSAVLAGGGAHLPFALELLERAKPAKGKVTLNRLPMAPAWTCDPVFGGAMAPFFRQLSIAIGAVLAPRDILIAGGVRF
jgi:molecular chaperone DnaK (HSP70)